MGSSCSSGQAHKDKDSVSTRSEESPSYQVSGKKSSQQQQEADRKSKKQQQHGNHSTSLPQQPHSGVILEASTVVAAVQQQLRGNNGGGGVQVESVATPSAVAFERKPTKDGLTKVRNIATSSISADSMSLSSPPGTSVQSPRDFDKCETSLPQEVQQLPENLQNLLMGRVASARTTTKTRKIVIYVCAADSQDCCIEKGMLHNAVYPTFRDYCRRQGYELHIVDLHWKTGLEKQQDHEFPELCLGELARQMEVAYVIPVLFLSNSLGTPLLPKTIEIQDFEMALSNADNKELLQKWYKLDGHAQPPCYRLQPIASHIPGFKENSPEEKESALNEWRSEIERTLAVMVNAFPQELRDTYLTTVVEQEVHNTVCMSQELARRCLWLYRVCAPAGGQSQDPPSSGEIELRRRLEALHKDLKNQLNEKHILRMPVRWVEGGLDLELPEHAQYVSDVTLQLNKHLQALVDTIIEEDQTKCVLKSSYGIDSRLFQELMQQTGFCQRAAQCSINREAVLQEIKSYVVGESQHPLVVYGPRGCGKTTLIARAAQCCHTWQPEALLVVRFVSISTQSHTTEQLLKSIVDQCSLLTYGQQSWAVHNIQSYTELLPRLLAASCIHRPQVIMIDAIDQVKEYGTQNLDWLPDKLPENVKIVLSVADDSLVFTEIQKKVKNLSALIPMPALGKLEAQSILMASVMQYNHSVNSRVQDCVRSSVQDCTLPLYVKVLAWQTSWWTDKDHDIVPKGNVTDQLHLMLEELETILGKERVEHALALVTAAKTGLSDSEMLDLLAHDAAFHSQATYVLWAPGCLFWARLNKYLAPFLLWSSVDGLSTLLWRDDMLYNAVKQRYLGDETRRRWAHQTLVNYYQGKWADEQHSGMTGRRLLQPDKTSKCYNRRKLDELPFQVFWLCGSLKEEFLYNHSWLYVKLCGSDVYHVLEDIALEEKSLVTNKGPEKDLLFLRKFLEECSCALAYDGRQFYSQLYGHLSAIFGSHEGKTPFHEGDLERKPSSSESIWESPEGYKFVRELYEVCCDPPVLSLLPLQPLVGGSAGSEEGKNVMDKLSVSAAAASSGGAVEVEDLDQLCRFDMVTRLVDNPDFVVTVSTEREEISVWDAHDAIPVRTLVGVTHPINLKAIDDTRCVVLCRRELRIYDLDSGEFVTRLKGVMNQKMPYYGLHDRGHLVALSRNRMYVNLMNLESGDCVTTFKAGEDRFLNSLLVSGDGRVLVCGDETQKPFPLLVWNLSSRKLLYDLRIPHHDFVTSLAAITHEGHYVCCVAKEVDEPCPNFIVVYDLQSGTLFKKWKPGVNTVSLDISSRDGCVISGLEDARILVWDLVTGNCRWYLCGHTAPVNFLRLDSLGGTFLSADSVCRDRSLRLWDLNKGELLAVYTPERPVTSCEVTRGGHFVVLALRGLSHITTLQLRGPQVDISVGSENHCYGHPENLGKTFDLRDEVRAAER
ncbi:NACHT and WD repeat domain-containing protein 2 isoform X2 [Zootermopsis nevadensis]|uniref:NACHT and WD repeat domain-containing protein 2 isoform X2 n=1 Tax=Zootermopsis nevadensis TaxID=136037 RepID=UPI000B8E5641|nr:NACHT and WD repeat domain-containing protein 2 isoform X2 [Zootermopsis nevadensis]